MWDKDGRNAGRSWPLAVTLALGIGLALAPVAFQMFSRAPKGGHMIDDFRPYMSGQKITRFQTDMSEIDAAAVEARTTLDPELERRFDVDAATLDRRYPLYTDFERKWPGIDADMTDMLATMHRDLPDYAAVGALPPFPLFPWFFVALGVLVAAASVWGLIRSRRRRSTTTAPVVALVLLGVGLLAAPVAFQMFTRAPKGGHMIDDFRPLMTARKVQTIQGYFLVMGAGEGTIRNEVLPDLAKSSALDLATIRARYAAIERFSADMPDISNEMAPMIGTMSDNVGNFQAVDALPPFPLFPWFFAIPGAVLVSFAFVARRRRDWPAPATIRAVNTDEHQMTTSMHFLQPRSNR